MFKIMKENGKKKRDHLSIKRATSRPLQNVTYCGPGGGGGGPGQIGPEPLPPALVAELPL